ncbi:hypothetical protein D3C75_255070 [compost metagenome]
MGMNAQQLKIGFARGLLNSSISGAVTDVEAELGVGLASRSIGMVGMGFNTRRHAQQHVDSDFLAGSDSLQKDKLHKVIYHKAADARFNRHFDLIRRLIVTVEVNALSREAGLQCCVQFAVRYDVQRQAFFVSQAAHRHDGEGLARISNLEAQSGGSEGIHILAAALTD